MIPETCEPTLTVTMAETSPVALTISLTGLRCVGLRSLESARAERRPVGRRKRDGERVGPAARFQDDRIGPQRAFEASRGPEPALLVEEQRIRRRAVPVEDAHPLALSQ